MKTPTTKQILKALKAWKQTLTDSVAIGGVVNDKKVQHEIACIDAAACHVIASSAKPVGARSTRAPLVAASSSWIPVAKEMPDTDTVILIAMDDQDEPVWMGYWNSDRDCWMCVDAGEAHNVTHWQHLPEPPKSEIRNPKS